MQPPVTDAPLPPQFGELPLTGRVFLEDLLRQRLIDRTAVGPFLDMYRDRLREFRDRYLLGTALVQAGLLTTYQLSRLQAGTAHGLVLGNYRVLETLGRGSVGIVFLGEHGLLRRRVAIKVLPVSDALPPSLLERFHGEMRVLASLNHPHIVTAYDAGALPPSNAGEPTLHYLVLELISGGDLETIVNDHGPVALPQACEWIRQAASGLLEAHDRHLIHRDLKPSNLLLTTDRRVKLVDFGLARQFLSQLTEPGTLLGSVEFMPPEQSLDPTSVGGEADVYGLGATLFWLLTGHPPYPVEANLAQALRMLRDQPPRRLHEFLPDAPAELDQLIGQMLARDPRQRPNLAVTVMQALAKFAAGDTLAWVTVDDGPLVATVKVPATPAVVIALPDDGQAALAARAMASAGCVCARATTATEVLARFDRDPFDALVIATDWPPPGTAEVCRRLRDDPRAVSLKILLVGRADEWSESTGADDLVPVPFDAEWLALKAKMWLQSKASHDRAERMIRHLTTVNRQLQHSLTARTDDVRHAQDALLYAMAKMAESRDGETPGHLKRLQIYSRTLAEELARDEQWKTIVDAAFLEHLERCTPLHDIGKLALPDYVLLKPGPLDRDERQLMETHTVIGSDILESIGRSYGEGLTFLQTARAIVRSHHERYDGTGYPDKLYGDAIPPAARIVALADVYDALRRKRFHKPSMSHAQAVRAILNDTATAFDPAVSRAFAACQGRFQRIYLEVIS